MRRPKDAAVSATARFLVNHEFGDIGRVTALSLDSGARSVSLSLDLAGESEPVELEIVSYSLQQEGSRTYLVIQEARSSREWLSRTIHEFVSGKAFPLPRKAALALR